MNDVAGFIAEGANAFLMEEYKYMTVYMILFSIVLDPMFILTLSQNGLFLTSTSFFYFLTYRKPFPKNSTSVVAKSIEICESIYEILILCKNCYNSGSFKMKIGKFWTTHANKWNFDNETARMRYCLTKPSWIFGFGAVQKTLAPSLFPFSEFPFRPGNLGLFGALLQPHAPENVFWQIFCENACTRARYYVVFSSFSRIRPTRSVDHRGMGGTKEASTHVRAIVLYRQALIVKRKKAARYFRFAQCVEFIITLL